MPKLETKLEVFLWSLQNVRESLERAKANNQPEDAIAFWAGSVAAKEAALVMLDLALQTPGALGAFAQLEPAWIEQQDQIEILGRRSAHWNKNSTTHYTLCPGRTP